MEKLKIDTNPIVIAGYRATQEKTWGHNRSEWASASSIGSCLRKQYLDNQHGSTAHKDLTDQQVLDWGMAWGGNITEDYVSAPSCEAFFGKALQAAGQSDQVTLFVEELKLAVTPDGFITKLKKKHAKTLGLPKYLIGQPIMIEFKSTNDASMAKYKRGVGKKYTQQVIAQIIAAQANGINAKAALIMFVNRANPCETIGYLLQPEEIDIDKVKTRAIQLKEATCAEDLPAEGSLEQYGCQYCNHTGSGTGLCDKGTFIRASKAKKISDDELAKTMESYQDLQDIIETSKEQLVECESILFEALSAFDVPSAGLIVNGKALKKRITTRSTVKPDALNDFIAANAADVNFKTKLAWAKDNGFDAPANSSKVRSSKIVIEN